MGNAGDDEVVGADDNRGAGVAELHLWTLRSCGASAWPISLTSPPGMAIGGLDGVDAGVAVAMIQCGIGHAVGMYQMVLALAKQMRCACSQDVDARFGARFP